MDEKKIDWASIVVEEKNTWNYSMDILLINDLIIMISPTPPPLALAAPKFVVIFICKITTTYGECVMQCNAMLCPPHPNTHPQTPYSQHPLPPTWGRGARKYSGCAMKITSVKKFHLYQTPDNRYTVMSFYACIHHFTFILCHALKTTAICFPRLLLLITHLLVLHSFPGFCYPVHILINFYTQFLIEDHHMFSHVSVNHYLHRLRYVLCLY